MEYNPLETEKKISLFWEEKKIFKKLMKRKSNKKFSFLDGPITANNPMGIHHALGRTYKDLFLRFKSMQGYEERRQNGFDCQGLWIEREVEKERGFRSKDDIEKFGILNFVNECKKRVERFSKLIEEDSMRLGMWMNWNDSYYTHTDNNNLHNWFLLKKYHERRWLFKGKDVVPWCPRCGTASSKHDILTEGYMEVTHTAIFMIFPLKKRNHEYLLIFTTTPWTIPANVAAAVNIDLNYVKAKQGEKYYWLAETRLGELKGEYEIIEKVKGDKLVGLEYEMPYSGFHAQEGIKQKIVGWEMASGEEGTGIVHIAPGCGPEDYDLGKKENLDAVSPLNESGFYSDDFDFLSRKHVGEVNKMVLEDMEKRGFIYKTEPYTHRYPHCWRCKTELVFRLVDEWYIRCDKIRGNLKEKNKKIYWYPEYGKQRQEEWFSNMGNWLISRKRYWGLPLPFWECSSGHLEVIGSMKELKEKAIKGMEQLKEIHRPWIDNVILRCHKCGNEMKRVPDVGDAWLDAGIVAFSTIGPYLKNKDYWKKWYPPDFVSENYPGQYRGWFNALFWSSATIMNEIPFKSVFGYESVKDEKGREMHKSLGNVVWAKDALEKEGADPLRWVFCLHDPSSELWFSFKECEEGKRNLNILFNTMKYLQTYFEANKFKKSRVKLDTNSKWIVSRLNTVVENVTKYLEELKPHSASKELQNFFLEDLSRWYGHVIRDDIKPEMKSKNKKAYLQTFYSVMLETLKMLSPFIPFLTEDLYQSFFKKYEKVESVHLMAWPKVNKASVNRKLETQMNLARQIVETANSKRHEVGIKLKYPLKNLTASGSKEVCGAAKSLKEIIKKLANVKEVKTKPSKEMNIDLNTEVDEKLKEEWLIRELIRNVQEKRKNLGFEISDRITLYLEEDNTFKNWKRTIEENTGSRIIFRKITGESFEFEGKKYNFEIK